MSYVEKEQRTEIGWLPSVQRIRKALKEQGLDSTVREFHRIGFANPEKGYAIVARETLQGFEEKWKKVLDSVPLVYEHKYWPDRYPTVLDRRQCVREGIARGKLIRAAIEALGLNIEEYANDYGGREGEINSYYKVRLDNNCFGLVSMNSERPSKTE